MINLKNIAAGAKLSALLNNKLVLALMSACVVFCVFFLVWTLLPNKSKQNEKKKAPGFEISSNEYFLSPFFLPVSNDAGDEKLVRIQFALKLTPGPDREIKRNITKYRSLLFSVLTTKRVEDLRDMTRLSVLRKEIREVLNRSLVECTVEKVLLTQILIL